MVVSDRQHKKLAKYYKHRYDRLKRRMKSERYEKDKEQEYLRRKAEEERDRREEKSLQQIEEMLSDINVNIHRNHQLLAESQRVGYRTQPESGRQTRVKS